MTAVIIANIISFVGSLIMVTMGLLRTKKQILLAQCAQCGLMSVSNILLGGWTGLVANVLTVLRNLVCFRRPFTAALRIGFIALQILLSAFTNTLGLIGWLPVGASVLFTWFMDGEDPLRLKAAIIGAQAMWLVYDLTILNYAGAVFDALTMVTSGVSIFTVLRSRKRA